MLWWLLWLIPLALVLFLAVLLVRTTRFVPADEPKPEPDPVSFDRRKAVEDLAELLRCKTVSSRNRAEENAEEFERFRQLLPRLFPLVHETCACERIGEHGLLYHWKGKSAEQPCVYMAHYDVVSVNAEQWERDPFGGEVVDGVLWGRGALDTKCTLCAVLESAEYLLGQNFVPEQDVYFSFAGNEEISGGDAPAIVDELARRGITPAMVIDEGGAVVENVFPGVGQPCALVGTGEKGIMDLELSVKSNGGHASSPPPHTPVGVLSRACVEVEAHPFPQYISRPAAEMFDTLGRRSSFAYRLIFANLWCFRPVLDAMCKKQGGELNALMRTTCAFTMMQGSRGANVIPPQASMTANLRLNGNETVESAQQYLRKVIGNDAVGFRVIYGADPSPVSEASGQAWERLCRAIGQTWPEAIVSPYLMIAASDSRHFARISKHVYRFSAMAVTAEERALMHGNNERIPVETVEKMVAFYIRLMRS